MWQTFCDRSDKYVISTDQNKSPGEVPSDNRDRYESAAECEICSQLRDLEDRCDKEYKDALLLPPAAYRLVPIPGSRLNSLEKCPLCGTYYDYIHFYEYSPMGNDEEEHLRRLPAAEALADLAEGEIYSELEDFARRGAAYATMVLVAINRSKLKRDTVEFNALQGLCKAMKQR
jgi:hypothetical protein